MRSLSPMRSNLPSTSLYASRWKVPSPDADAVNRKRIVSSLQAGASFRSVQMEVPRHSPRISRERSTGAVPSAASAAVVRMRPRTSACRLAGATLCDQLTNVGNEIDRNFHYGMGRRLERFLVFRGGLVVGLGLVVIEDPPDSRLVPTFREFRIGHDSFLRLRRKARKPFRPNSYAVMTKTDFG